VHEIQTPTLILYGKRDKIVPLTLTEDLHARIPHSKLLLFEGGHVFFFMRERQRFLDAVADFLGA
jgi:pimeloyl-ACP methyl ester carboxylesterase